MTQKFMPTIKTGRLVLRPLKLTDAEALLTIFSDPDVMKYWNTAPWNSLEDAMSFIKESTAAMDRQESITLGIMLEATSELIGKCMLFSYESESKRAEIGFGIGKQYWGYGFVSEAGEALIKYGFESLGLRRIEAEIDPENISSGRALERLGFIKEGLLRQRWEINGVVSDSALYGLLAGDHLA
ncbi:GNAT family N-acetyltransferase [Vreelandella olivaria]|uniref:GNAT family N-acetyltransferase n=1 Tax=Vreelandella olivaria TaxID=390919 RepID=UPI00201ECB7C|nr:GNAT family N-acetyltransferase [Halomonas olivaria]